jgi:catechol 2,3-dioxygenase-like lactoylglutathione lyase family enzyme
MQRIAHVMVVVRDYDEAIAFYCGTLGFDLLEDTYQPEQDKRWVVVAPLGGGSSLVLGRASDPGQEAAIGNQSGGRVFLFLQTDDFQRDLERYREAGVTFVREPKGRSRFSAISTAISGIWSNSRQATSWPFPGKTDRFVTGARLTNLPPRERDPLLRDARNAKQKAAYKEKKRTRGKGIKHAYRT